MSQTQSPEHVTPTGPPVPRATAATRGRPGAVPLVLNNIVWVLLVLFAIVGYLLNPFFFSIPNAQNILVQATTLGFLAVGIAFTLLIGEIDLSVVGVLGFSGAIGAVAVNNGVPPLLSILLVIATGGLIGLINGFCVAKLKMNSLITTLAVGLTLGGAVLAITEGTTITIDQPGYTFIGTQSIGGWPIMPLALVILFVVVFVLLNRTRWGRSIYATGGSERASFAAGVRTTRVRMSAFVVSGLLAGCAGWIATAYLSGVNSTIGSDILLYAIAAPVIGGVSLTGGVGKVAGILGGILLITVVQVGLQLSSISAYYITMAGGAMIFVAVLIDIVRIRVRR
ncbi:ABC transporter permease [Nakamurella flavida]|uniref:Xylose transport system permease protein XylH n=1 Tax=Nakamurella flavida TaxID=363630 RepID=A0A938YP93_9ACTN|nr:ABC transporter permease [Nakamurella flavida]MBM9478196.1 ABC transporter permease [Nakamurella flavida]MDP9778582.1 simple sugar transport system permease protein/ribose transport system permease protein [Nakamurella flavida]